MDRYNKQATVLLKMASSADCSRIGENSERTELASAEHLPMASFARKEIKPSVKIIGFQIDEGKTRHLHKGRLSSNTTTTSSLSSSLSSCSLSETEEENNVQRIANDKKSEDSPDTERHTVAGGKENMLPTQTTTVLIPKRKPRDFQYYEYEHAILLHLQREYIRCRTSMAR